MEVREELGGLRGGPGGVGKPSRRFRRGQEALPIVWEALSEDREALSEVGRGREALQYVCEGLAGPRRGPVGVRRPSWRSGRGQEYLPQVREGSGVPPEGP